MTASKRKKPLLKDYDGLDAAKAIAVIDGEMQDLRKVTARETPAGNAGLEISLHLRELQRIRTIFTDQQMAESMSAANLNDAAAIAAISHEEHAAQCDHEMALALQGGRNRATRTNINRPAATTNSTEIDATVLSKLAARHVSVSAGEALLPSTGQETDSQSQRANRDCVICLDSKPWFELLSVPCQHDYCTDCLRSLFRDSYTDETLFPPKCCQQVIPINGADITLYLPKDLREPYETRRIETTTTNRTYCIACSKFILPSNITNHTAKCTACQTSTCAKCKKAAHTGDCVADENDRLALELAERQGWRACFQCRRTIELSHGCYHMRFVRLPNPSPFSNLFIDACAVLNSATAAAGVGKPADAPSGQRDACTLEPT